MSAVAKTVSHSPLRPNPAKASFKNILDNPFKSKWPVLSQPAALQIREQLESSLCGLKDAFSRTRPISRTKCLRKRRKRRSETKIAEQSSLEPLAKRTCKKDDDDNLGTSTGRGSSHTDPAISLPEQEAAAPKPTTTTATTTSTETPDNDDPPQAVQEKDSGAVTGDHVYSDEIRAKKLQLVVGVNAVTRLLEHGDLLVGLLCSSSPGLLCQHLLPLAATREVPFASLPDLSVLVARLLGIRKAMCIGLKKTSSANAFPALTDLITTLSPMATLPWLAADKAGLTKGGVLLATPTGRGEGPVASHSKDTGERGRGKVGVAAYHPLNMKRVDFQPNSKNKRTKQKQRK